MAGFFENFGKSVTGQFSGMIGGALGGHLGFGGGAIGGMIGGLLGSAVGGGTPKPATENPLSEAAADLKDAANSLRDAANRITPQVPQAPGQTPPPPMPQGPLMGAVGNSAVNPATGLPLLNSGVAQQPAPMPAAAAGGEATAAAGPIGLVIAGALVLKAGVDKLYEGFHQIVDVAPRVTESFAGLIGLPKTLQTLLGSAAGVVVAPLHMAAEALHQFMSPLELLKDPTRVLKIGFTAITDAGSALTQALWSLRDPASMLEQSIAPFIAQIAKFNPGIIDRLNLAFGNLSAAAGRMFEPIVAPLTAFADELNGAYTAIGPAVRGLVADLTGMGISVGREVFASLFQIIGEGVPIVRGLIEDLRPFAPTARMILAALTDFVIGAMRFGGDMLHGALEFVQPIVEAGQGLIGFVRETGRGLMSLWEAGRPLREMFGVLIPPGNVFASVLQVATTGLQFFAATLSASASVIRRVVDNLNRPIWERENPFSGFADDFRAAMARMQAGAPAAAQLPSGGFTPMAQQARHVGIEDIGMEARRAAFSQGQGVQQQQLEAQQDAARTLRELMRFLQQNFPGIGVPVAPAPEM